MPTPSSSSSAALSLDAVVALGLAQAEDAEVARLRVSERQAELQQAVGRFLPSIQAGGSLRPGASVRPIEGSSFTTRSEDALNGSLVFTQPLVNLEAVADLEQARQVVRRERFTKTETHRLLSFQIAEQFLLVLARRALQAVAERRLRLAEKTVRDVAARQRAGLLPRTNLTRAKMEKNAAAIQRETAGADVVEAELLLSHLVGGRRVLAPTHPLKAPPFPARIPGPDRPTRQARALSRHVALRAMRRDLQAAEASVLSTWAALLPTLSLVGAGRATNQVVGDNALTTDVTLSAAWNLFDGTVREFERVRQKRISDRLRFTLQKETRGVLIALEQAWAVEQAQRRAWAEAQERCALAEENLKASEQLFAQGLIGFIERLDALKQTVESQNACVAQTLDVRTAALRRQKAEGRVATTGAAW